MNLVSRIKDLFRSAAPRVALAVVVAAGPTLALPTSAHAGGVGAELAFVENERGMMAGYITITLSGPVTVSQEFSGDSAGGVAVFNGLPAGTYTVEVTDMTANQFYTSMSGCGGGAYHDTTGSVTVSSSGVSGCQVNMTYSDYGPPTE